MCITDVPKNRQGKFVSIKCASTSPVPGTDWSQYEMNL